MKIAGKLIGAVLGWMLLRHPLGAVLGVLIGHVIDAGWWRGGTDAAVSRREPPVEDDYAVLGITPQASDAEVEAAFRRKISDYHPDKVAGAAEEIRQLAETRARAINQAYEAICRRRKRP